MVINVYTVMNCKKSTKNNQQYFGGLQIDNRTLEEK